MGTVHRLPGHSDSEPPPPLEEQVATAIERVVFPEGDVEACAAAIRGAVLVLLRRNCPRATAEVMARAAMVNTYGP